MSPTSISASTVAKWWSRYLRTQLCNFLHVAHVYKYARILRRLGYWAGRDVNGLALGDAMKSRDILVIGLVSIVFRSRSPSLLNSLTCELISKKRLTALSAVCDLLGLLVACDYAASQFSPVGQKPPGWIAAEIVCWVASGLFLRPGFRTFLARLFAKSPSRTQPVKGALSTR
jgi:hypothetical protein